MSKGNRSFCAYRAVSPSRTIRRAAPMRVLFESLEQRALFADVSAVAGSAYGYYSSISLFGGSPSITGPTPSVTLPAGGSSTPITATATSGSVTIGPATFFSSDAITVSTQGVTGPGGSATSSTDITNVNTSGLEPFTAARVVSTSSASEAGVTGSTAITGGTLQTSDGDPNVDGDETVVSIPVNPAPNTFYDGVNNSTGDSFRYVFNEQIVNADGSLTVNAAHQYLLGPTAVGDLIIGQSVAGVTLVPTPPSPTTLAIDDVTLAEGDSGTTDFIFTVTRSGDLSGASSVTFATADGTATTGDNDYDSNTGTLNFAASQTTATITVVVNGDTTVESNEAFTVTLSAPTGATVSDGTGSGTITNDDTPPPPSPTFSINDVTDHEGDSGLRQFVFTVIRDGSTAGTASVQYQTHNETAGAADYKKKSGTLHFADGQASRTISIAVKGDTKVEGNETFRISLFNPSGATIADGQGIGTILNDDGIGGLSSTASQSVNIASFSDTRLDEDDLYALIL